MDVPLDLSLKECRAENTLNNEKTEATQDTSVPQVLGTGKENAHSKLNPKDSTIKGFKKNLLERANRQNDDGSSGTVSNRSFLSVEPYMDIARSPSKGYQRTSHSSVRLVTTRSPMKDVQHHMDMILSKGHQRTPHSSVRLVTTRSPMKDVQHHMDMILSKGHQRTPHSSVRLVTTRSPMKDVQHHMDMILSKGHQRTPHSSVRLVTTRSPMKDVQHQMRVAGTSPRKAHRKTPLKKARPLAFGSPQKDVQPHVDFGSSPSKLHRRTPLNSVLLDDSRSPLKDKTNEAFPREASRPRSVPSSGNRSDAFLIDNLLRDSPPRRPRVEHKMPGLLPLSLKMEEEPHSSSLEPSTAPRLSTPSIDPATTHGVSYNPLSSLTSFPSVFPTGGYDGRSTATSVRRFSDKLSSHLASEWATNSSFLEPISIDTYSMPNLTSFPGNPAHLAAASFVGRDVRSSEYVDHGLLIVAPGSGVNSLMPCNQSSLGYFNSTMTRNYHHDNTHHRRYHQGYIPTVPPLPHVPATPSHHLADTTPSLSQKYYISAAVPLTSTASLQHASAGHLHHSTISRSPIVFREAAVAPWFPIVTPPPSNHHSAKHNTSVVTAATSGKWSQRSTKKRPAKTVTSLTESPKTAGPSSAKVQRMSNHTTSTTVNSKEEHSSHQSSPPSHPPAPVSLSYDASGLSPAGIVTTVTSGVSGKSDGGRKQKDGDGVAGKRGTHPGSETDAGTVDQSEGAPPLVVTTQEAAEVMKGLCDHMMTLHKAKTNEELVLKLAPQILEMLQTAESRRPGSSVVLINEGFALSDPDWVDPMTSVKMHQTMIDGKVQHCWYDKKGALQSKPSMREASRCVRRSHGRYVCIFCTKRFADATDMVRHTRTHTKVKPFACETCNTSYSQQVTLEQHQLKNHKITPHIKGHKYGKLHTCEMCGVLFLKQQHYVDHLQELHPSHSHLQRLWDKRLFENATEKKKTRKSSGK